MNHVEKSMIAEAGDWLENPQNYHILTIVLCAKFLDTIYKNEAFGSLHDVGLGRKRHS